MRHRNRYLKDKCGVTEHVFDVTEKMFGVTDTLFSATEHMCGVIEQMSNIFPVTISNNDKSKKSRKMPSCDFGIVTESV